MSQNSESYRNQLIRKLLNRTPDDVLLELVNIKEIIIGVVTLQTFTEVKPIYLGQIHQKSPEVNSSWVGR